MSAATATYDTDGQLQRFASGTTSVTRNGAAVASANFYSSGSAAAGDLLQLGNWGTSTWTVGASASLDTRFAYVTGVPIAPQFVLTNQRATYSLAAATPVYTSQNRVGSIASASLSVDFFTRNTNSLGTLAVAVDLPNGTGSVAERYNLNGTLAGNGATLSGVLGITGATCTGVANPCLGASVAGFFANAAGTKVGLTFEGNTTTVGSFGGALAFTQAGARGTLPSNVGNFAASYVTSFAYLNSIGGPAQRITVPDGDRVFFQGAELIESRPRGSQPDIVKNGPVTASSARAGGIGVPGSLDFIGWGSWESGNINGTTGLPVISNVHYIVATPTTNASMPTSGTASYNLVGGSAPVSTTRGTGTLNSGTLTANFTNATVGTLLNLGFGNTTYTVGGTGQFRQPGGYDAAIIVPGTGSNGAPIAAVINGVFSGANAYRAGIAYSFTGSSSTIGVVNGAAVFQRVP
ncbi:hypothetical protein [Variovorax sp. PvP013]|uniref:hypothetical protein n=1 Tax=Variovorax sp. PvP013 TaxID=3156435 RepID=UPI003D1E9F0A